MRNANTNYSHIDMYLTRNQRNGSIAFAPPSDRWPGTQWPQAVLPDDFPLGQFTSPIAANAALMVVWGQ